VRNLALSGGGTAAVAARISFERLSSEHPAGQLASAANSVHNTPGGPGAAGATGASPVIKASGTKTFGPGSARSSAAAFVEPDEGDVSFAQYLQPSNSQLILDHSIAASTAPPSSSSSSLHSSSQHLQEKLEKRVSPGRSRRLESSTVPMSALAALSDEQPLSPSKLINSILAAGGRPLDHANSSSRKDLSFVVEENEEDYEDEEDDIDGSWEEFKAQASSIVLVNNSDGSMGPSLKSEVEKEARARAKKAEADKDKDKDKQNAGAFVAKQSKAAASAATAAVVMSNYAKKALSSTTNVPYVTRASRLHLAGDKMVIKILQG
jgi:hypothetical protein